MGSGVGFNSSGRLLGTGHDDTDSTTLAGLPPDINAYYLADFLAGCFDPSTSENVVGDPKRQVFVKTWSLAGQDAWQVSKRLSLDYGIRYDYEGPVHSQYPNLSVFDPSLSSGLAVVGQDVPNSVEQVLRRS